MLNYKDIKEKIEFDAAMILVDEGYTETNADKIAKKVRTQAIQKAYDNLSENEQLIYALNSCQFIEHMKEKFPLDSIIQKYKKN